MVLSSKKTSKTEIKKNSNYYIWLACGIVFLLLGIEAIVTGSFSRHVGEDVKGNAAYIFGSFLIIISVLDLYYLVFKAKKYEERRIDFHELEKFEEYYSGYKTKFEIEDVFIPQARSGLHVYYYKLIVFLNEKLDFDLHIRQRNKFEYILWKIGLTRILNMKSGNYYFDSRYIIKSNNTKRVTSLLNIDLVNKLEEFDKSYIPIRSDNGTLIISSSRINYIEGPYRDDHRIFDPHRGNIEVITKDLTEIAGLIEKFQMKKSL